MDTVTSMDLTDVGALENTELNYDEQTRVIDRLQAEVNMAHEELISKDAIIRSYKTRLLELSRHRDENIDLNAEIADLKVDRMVYRESQD